MSVTKEQYAIILHDHGYSDFAIESLWQARPLGIEGRVAPEAVEQIAAEEMADPFLKKFYSRSSDEQWLNSLTPEEHEKLIREHPRLMG